jgi:hypothetical protein
VALAALTAAHAAMRQQPGAHPGSPRVPALACGRGGRGVTNNEVDVSLLGSYNADAMNIELYLRVRAWEAGRRSTGVEVELVD